MTLTKDELAGSIDKKINLSVADTKLLVDNFFETIIETLIEGESVKITGFGNFELKDKKARPGRNPKTGEEVEISARRVVTFKAGDKLKEKVC